MPYNGSGGFSVETTLTANTLARASDLNTNFDDIANGLSDVLVRDGQAAMTGQFKAHSGTKSAPGLSWASELSSGWYRAGSGDFRFSLSNTDMFKVTSAGITIMSGALSGSVTLNDGSVALTKLADQADGTLLANISGASDAPTAITASELLDDAFGSTQGMVLYRGASGWSALSVGTSGQFLKTQGAAANPTWAEPLPSQSGKSGQVLTTNGTSASWTGQTVTANAAVSTNTGAAPTISFSNNIASITRSGSGVWVVTLTGVTGTSFTVSVTGAYVFGASSLVPLIGKSSGVFTISWINKDGAAQDPTAGLNVDITVFGGL